MIVDKNMKNIYISKRFYRYMILSFLLLLRFSYSFSQINKQEKKSTTSDWETKLIESRQTNIFKTGASSQTGKSSISFKGHRHAFDNPFTWQLKEKTIKPHYRIDDYHVFIERENSLPNKPLFFFADVKTGSINGEAHLDFSCFRKELQMRGNSFADSLANGGHTSWDFNPDGTLNQPGDVIISTDYYTYRLSGIAVRIWVNPERLPGGSLTSYNKLPNPILKFTGDFHAGKKSKGYGYAEIKSLKDSSSLLFSKIEHPEVQIERNADGYRKQKEFNFLNARPNNQYISFGIDLEHLGLDVIKHSRIHCYSQFSYLMVTSRATSKFSSGLKAYTQPKEFASNQEHNLKVYSFSEIPISGKNPAVQLGLEYSISSQIYYSWTGPKNFTSIGSSPIIKVPGQYAVSVSSQYGCSSIERVKVIGDTATARLTVKKTNVSCNGLSDGSIHLTIDSGKPPYTIEWSNGSQNTLLEGLTAGLYSVTVTGDNGGKSFLKTKITEPMVLNARSSKKMVSKMGGQDGDAIVMVTGGTLPYSYTWDTNPVQTSNKATHLKAGTYTIHIKDAKSCEYKHEVIITEPLAPNK